MLLLLWYVRLLFEYRVYFWPRLWRYNVKYWNTVLKQSLHFLNLPLFTYEILNFLLLLALTACCFSTVSCFNICWFLLTHFRPMFIVYNPWKHLKWLTVFLFFFLIGIDSMQGWIATTRYRVTRKRSTKRLNHHGNLSRKNL